ncbi:isoaspartyl peptidase/L-asparaginase family protein [Pukyongiella litopenaei]|uniref:Isoaspartyl peptidase n=1 Tax=Pukyongiella litopenaei TaxID=2605946 RepID=A0A2S0MR56_9RHOB|nr:isoaspartyl peptidase/L-asparaginase [Pukyongiella litopenaei]AVO38354.1 isoaspartyl peptidase/L-asparaginase [Pukyongiella litopenaei]
MTYALAVHGGAGTILKSRMTPGLEAAYHVGLARALEAGQAILKQGGGAIDAVTAAVCALEDEPLFNAGRGAVFTADGKQEMDAAIMDGETRQAGAVAGLFGPRNPIRAARSVMERTEHVMLIGDNALRIARDAELPFEDASYFFTQARWDALQETLKMRANGEQDDDPARRHGTVGAVALDANGHIAAATSTGGMTAKAPGRVGDTPLIGAGTFADDSTCAVSCTGHGEIFTRWTAAAEISARMRHLGETVDQAAEHVVMNDLAPNDGSGGAIAIDANGRIAMPFNCEGMYRGSVGSDLALCTSIYG